MSNVVVVGAGGSASVGAACPAGKSVLGGDAYTTAAAVAGHEVQGYPVFGTPDTYYGRLVNSSATSTSLIAIAICGVKWSSPED
ncbi:hypothetical protein [Nocardioides sp.]|uniref:hypothetical protein n=1 Tax=Nocardioides sp. TaxID=35761 RepID=UPI0039E3FFDE